ncbi:DUF6114 domain-containing protein [Cuniculiplasma sp. SKW3]|uniref:DUF6114 domain-containing protein n=1 Tax=Cuniculiplasma sp. SKW3 TaxID=3400170 RepID=UPI003FCFC913
MVDREKLRKFFSYFSIFNRNRDAAVITIIGGIITMAVALIILDLIISSGNVSEDDIALLMIGGIIPALMEILGGLSMWFRESLSKIAGVIVIFGSLLSLLDTEGGLAIGFFLAIFGGIMSLMYHPNKSRFTDN